MSALAKIVQVLPTRLRRRVEALRAMTVPMRFDGRTDSADPGVLSTLALACRDGERVEFGYTTRDGRSSTRQAEPHRLVAVSRRWYLVAYDLHRHDWRSFRLDRMDPPTPTGRMFATRTLPAEDAAAFVRASLVQRNTEHLVDVVAQCAAEHAERTIGRWSTVEPLGRDSCRIRMNTDGLGWAAFALGSLDVEFTVHNPPELRGYLRGMADRFGRA
jgi:predicted DNA-binding transcriptional regulator YafY